MDWKPEGFEIVREIGRGGMGVVFEAFDVSLSRRVAIKTFHRGMGPNAEVLRRFEREARAAASVTHPSVVTIYSIGHYEDFQYLVMEYVQGSTIADEIDRSGAFSADRAVRLIRQACGGLGAAHAQGLIHRDIKPHNLLLTTDGQVKITDFGLVAFAEGVSDLTLDGSFMGTPHYMAPELCRGERPTYQSDVYALGVVLYEMLAGKHAIQCENVPEFIRVILNEPFPDVRVLRPETPSWLAGVISTATAKSAIERFPNCEAMSAALKLGYSSDEVRTLVVSAPVVQGGLPGAEPEPWDSDYESGQGIVLCFVERDAATGNRIAEWIKSAGYEASLMMIEALDLTDDEIRLLGQRKCCLLIASGELAKTASPRCISQIRKHAPALLPLMMENIPAVPALGGVRCCALHALRTGEQRAEVLRALSDLLEKSGEPQTAVLTVHGSGSFEEAKQTPQRLVNPVQNAHERARARYLYNTGLSAQLGEALTVEGATVHLRVGTRSALCAARRLVRDYAERQKYQYDVIWWIDSGSAIRRTIDYAAMGPPLRIKDGDSSNIRAVTEVVREWIASAKHWLLIFCDPATALGVQRFLPPNHRGRVVVISSGEDGLPGQPTVDIGRLCVEQDGVLSRFEGSNDAIIEAVEGSSLAHALVDRYLAKTGEDVSEHLAALAKRTAEIGGGSGSSEASLRTAAAQLGMSLTWIAQELPQAIDFAKLCSLLDPAEIPSFMLVRLGKSDNPEIARILGKDAWSLAAEELIGYGVLEPQSNGVGVDPALHDLLWRWMLDDSDICGQNGGMRLMAKKNPLRVDAAGREELIGALMGFFVERLLEMLAEETPWPEFSSYLSHAHAVLVRAETCGIVFEESAMLWEILARVYVRFGLREYARGAMRRAIDSLEGETERDAGRLTRLYLSLARVFQEDNDLPRMALHLRNAIESWEALADATASPEYVTALTGLAETALKLGNKAEAKSAYDRIVHALANAELHAENTAARLHERLGAVATRIGQRADAARHLGFSLRMIESCGTPDKRIVRRLLRMLAYTYKKLDDVGAAASFASRAVDEDVAEYGENHPRTVSDRANLAMILWGSGERDLAIAQLERTVEQAGETYGPDSREVALFAYNLATFYQDSKQLAHARKAYEKSVRLFASTVGPEHRYTLTAQTSLEKVVRRMDRKVKAGKQKE